MNARPWTIDLEAKVPSELKVRDGDGQLLCRVFNPGTDLIWVLNEGARAVNLHDEMVEALRAIADPEHCLTEHTVEGLRHIAKVVLAKAERK